MAPSASNSADLDLDKLLNQAETTANLGSEKHCRDLLLEIGAMFAGRRIPTQTLNDAGIRLINTTCNNLALSANHDACDFLRNHFGITLETDIPKAPASPLEARRNAPREAMEDAWQVLLDAGIAPGQTSMSLADGIRAALAVTTAQAGARQSSSEGGTHFVDGWKRVPVEPTEAMVHAGEDVAPPRPFAKVYRAMIAAAPSPAQAETPIYQVRNILHPNGWHDVSANAYEINKGAGHQVRVLFAAPAPSQPDEPPSRGDG